METVTVLTLKTVAVLGFFTNNIENGVDKLCTFGVMAFGPVISSARLSKDEVIRSKDLSIGTSSHTVHGSWLQIHKNSTGNIASTAGFVVVDIDTLELHV